ncbi:sperm-specific sodium:proton exchanger-like isoform X2 [Ornithodoros turicata]|uniref:sperm-specific sodium:proton exchanger-like isoform X2 n=1 Tax=Ornithodoros turicata TaxID=34597 RepID=UPI0031389B8E
MEAVTEGLAETVTHAATLAVEAVTEEMTAHHHGHLNASGGLPPEEGYMEIEEHDLPRAAAPILFLFVSFVLGSLVRFLLKRHSIQLPYTVVVFIFGVLMGVLSGHYEQLKEYTYLARIDPKLLLHMFLPILIFESAFAMDAHTFIRCFTQCILMAVPGLILCSALTAFLSVNLYVSYEWTWHNAFLFGSILSATDPVAVVALLRDVGTSKILTTIIDGEALLNDGSAIVIYEVLMELAVPGMSMTPAEIGWMFVRIAIGGPLLGIVFGKVAVWSLARVFNDAVIEITITLSSAYLTYYVAEAVLGVSGVLAVVALGVIISANKVSISPEVEEFVHSFWEMLSYLANTLIFIIVGVVITERSVSYIEKNDLFLILITYIGITVFRLVMIGVLSPILTRLGYGLKWQDAIIMTWGGLRGAVGLALALSVAENRYINHDTVGNKILIQVSGIVILTLLVNATTTNFLLGILGMNAISPWKRSNMANAVRHLREVQERALHVNRDDVFLADADWKYVARYTTIRDPFNPKCKGDDDDYLDDAEHPNSSAYMFRKLSHVSLCPDCSEHHLCQPSIQEKDEMMNEARVRMISAQKVHFWRQFENGLLLRESVSALQSAADVVSDRVGQFITVTDLRRNWEVSSVYKWLQDHFVDPWVEKTKKANSRQFEKMPKEAWRKPCYLVAQHAVFNFLVGLVLLVDIACTVTEFVLRMTDCETCLAVTILRWTNVGFVVFYIFECIFELLAKGFRVHFRSYWNILDFIVLCISIGSAVVEIEMELTHSWYSEYIVLLRLCRVLRLLRVKRVLRVFLPLGNKLADLVTHRVNVQLSKGYDIGRGFMMGQSDVSKIVDYMVDYQPIAEKLKKICTDSRLEIVRELATLQEKYPKVAVAVKTRRAVRHVLNSTRAELIELKEAGMLDDGVFHKLMEVIEEKMMRLHSAPQSIVPAPPTELLKNVVWIKENEELFNYFQENVQLQHFGAGWCLGKEGDEPSGIYVIICGVIKVDGVVTRTEGGSLPNTDSYHWFISEGHMQDLLTVGAVLGELGVLTKKPRETRATCDTDVRAFHIPQQVMLDAIEKFHQHPSLEYKLWRSCALKVARGVLSLEPKYENWPPSKLMMHLDQAFLPDLSMVNSYLVKPTMTDVVLVQGIATDVNNSDEFFGPTYIPSTVYSITIRKNVNNDRTILVIVGNESFTPDPDVDWSGTAQRRMSVMNNFGLCLLHDVRRRQSIMPDREDDDPRARSWSDNFRRRFLSNADTTLPLSKRRTSMFSQGEKSGVDNPNFVTERGSELTAEGKPSWSDRFRVRFDMAHGGHGGRPGEKRRGSMFCRMERIDSYGNMSDQQNGETKSQKSNDSKEEAADPKTPDSQVPEIVFSHF